MAKGKPTSASWKPGQSGNPKGRPPNIKFLSEWLREVLQENDGAKARWVIAALLYHTGTSVDAIKVIFDRAEGKVAQPIIGDEEAPIPVTFQLGKGPTKKPEEMTDEELEAAKEQVSDDGDGD